MNGLRVSLAECDLLSISINLKIEYTIAASSMIQPATFFGRYSIPTRLNQGNFILI